MEQRRSRGGERRRKEEGGMRRSRRIKSENYSQRFGNKQRA